MRKPPSAAFQVGMRDETDHGHEGESAISALGEPAVDHGLLRADVSILSSESYMEARDEGEHFCYPTVQEPTVRLAHTLLCDPASFECALLPKSVEVVSPGGVGDDGCEGIDLSDMQPRAAPSEWALNLTVESATQVRFALASGEGQQLPVGQSLAWRERSEIMPHAF